MLLFRARKHIHHKTEFKILHKTEGGLPKTKPVPQLLDKRVLIRPWTWWVCLSAKALLRTNKPKRNHKILFSAFRLLSLLQIMKNKAAILKPHHLCYLFMTPLPICPNSPLLFWKGWAIKSFSPVYSATPTAEIIFLMLQVVKSTERQEYRVD